ncbi:hypothetical protein A3A64_01335 [Candidatus Gottesmanbacteria bacterium RIFCSPLOWO2_01_FULL_48_11]|uniref:Polymerase III, delta prime subunit protein n=2 Tax=Candidatus Gottesmaniibacteriota TaxID=1752720 RepID=A0A0G1UQA1_9BACT|nr:MAG: polymerase III, delta prime subunit protein [Candidatus Gottesmanbacteria bacterium GW2011_GWA1_48_13]OGG28103.1 MAG: hypothetical protein A3A64_01335 [Candidatus Gottesmanbacteria bacterium RIFCSPLOWO2_01_FULL_48_11]
MHAYLITGRTKEDRINYIINKQAELKASRFDAITLAPTEETIGIANVRDFQGQLLLSPYNSPKKIGIIKDAHTMTVEAQNALLKTLEEPPPRTVLFLECSTNDTLLPTIVSRCQLINLGVTTANSDKNTLLLCFETIEQACALPVGKRLAIVDEIAKTREDAKQWVELAIFSVRNHMLRRYGFTEKTGTLPSDLHNSQFMIHDSRLLRSLLTAQAQLSANVTPKLVLDTVFLSLSNTHITTQSHSVL